MEGDEVIADRDQGQGTADPRTEEGSNNGEEDGAVRRQASLGNQRGVDQQRLDPMETGNMMENAVRYHRMDGGEEKRTRAEETRGRHEEKQNRASNPNKNHYRHG